MTKIQKVQDALPPKFLGMEGMVQRIKITAAVEMGTVNQSTLKTLEESSGRVQETMRGSFVFFGPRGTAKTTAALQLAQRLGLDLYRIDLSAIVNKYIGETEKNLDKLFDAAEDSGAILFFDEADALFGKRSEVKDSHDRYASIEISYLLQKMEKYKGVSIFATNLQQKIRESLPGRKWEIVDFP